MPCGEQTLRGQDCKQGRQIGGCYKDVVGLDSGDDDGGGKRGPNNLNFLNKDYLKSYRQMTTANSLFFFFFSFG